MLKEAKRIPAKKEDISLVFSYGALYGIKFILKNLDLTPEIHKEIDKRIYETTIKPLADLARKNLKLPNAVSFDYRTMEFVVYEQMADEVDFDTVNKEG